MVPKSASAFCILKGPKNLHFVVTWADMKSMGWGGEVLEKHWYNWLRAQVSGQTVPVQVLTTT